MGRAYALEVNGADLAARVPPAIFLTLIENGLVHQRAAEGATFNLRVTTTPQVVTYVFFSPASRSTNRPRPPGGTGLRYVKARLEESFPGRWTFADHPTGTGWETVIELRTAPRTEAAYEDHSH